MNRFSFRLLVAATFAVSPLISASRAHAAPALPLPASQKPTSTATPRAAAQKDSSEPLIAPPNVDVPLRRPTPKPADAKAVAPAGPLPQIAPIPLPRDENLARDNNSSSNAKGASVGGVGIEGLSDRAALARLRRALDVKLRAPISLSDGVKTWTLRRDELGATAPLLALIRAARLGKRDVALRFNLDEKKATTALRRLAPQVNRVVPGGRDGAIPIGLTVSRGPQRVSLSIGGSVERVRQAIESQPPRLSVDLAVTMTSVATEESNSRNVAGKPWLKNTPYLLAAFSTPYDAGVVGRTTNLKLAARNVDGTIVAPEKIFSTNMAIGKRNAANGWKEAKMFMDGQVVNGVGSGICQCASTLYNAALLAGLPIVERHPHTFRVSYAPASRDATIYWGSKDFRFRNNTKGPIYVRTWLENQRFHVELYGIAPVTQEIEIVSRVLSRKGGTRSQAFRVVKTASGETQEKLSSDFYRPHP